MQNDNENQNDFKEELKKDFATQLDIRTRMEEIRVETYNKIKDDPQVLEFLKPYNSRFYDIFLQDYARRKGLWIVFKDTYKREQEERELQFLEAAKAGLECLQKKKMYNLRREWGAELIELPGMNTTFDFMLNIHNVFALDWMPRITEDEVALVKEYVLQHTGGELMFLLDFEARYLKCPFKMEEGKTDGMADSFAKFYDLKTGESKLEVLVDKRGARAQAYVVAYSKHKKELDEEKIRNGEMERTAELDLRPFPPTERSRFFESFIQKFDTQETWFNYLNYKNHFNPLGEEEEDNDDQVRLPVKDRIGNVYSMLRKLDVVLPVKANQDWRKALIEAWDEYERHSIAEALNQAYETYLFHEESGLQFITRDIEPTTEKLVNDLKEKLLAGRELMGEPRDLDF